MPRQAGDERTDARRTWLIVGLGNPGEQYALTAHNLGFLVVDRLGERNGIRIRRKEAAALAGSGRIGSTPVVLAKPQTFMNRSGVAVKALVERFAEGPGDLALVYDELALPWGSLRIRAAGSAGGHHGVESVIGTLGTSGFCRVRLGIHPGHEVKDGAKYVLAPLGRARVKELDGLLDLAAQAVECIVAEGVEKSMTKFNRRAQGVEKEEE